MNLKQEVAEKSKEIYTDSYSISLGEIMSMYKEGELNIHPDFQRVFRWTDLQRSKLIESLLLGIPIPSIFVSQEENGKWDIVDGLQRLSTIFQFFGILKDENGILIPNLVLQKTKILSLLERETIETIDPSLVLDIKRSKLNVQIVQRKSDDKLRYELFQRLNSLGSRLTDQELRNCLILMMNKPFYIWLFELSKDQNFLDAVSLSDKQIEEQYNMELVLRFLIFKNSNLDEIKSSNDIAEFLNEKTQEMCLNETFNYETEKSSFLKVFKLINLALQDSTFKKYYTNSESFKGKFMISSFEAITIGLAKNINSWDESYDIEKLKQKIITLWSQTQFTNNIGAGANFYDRIPKIMPFSEEYFKNEDQDRRTIN
ncbi:MAG: DUF262 domain-containing protein [Nanoarchaeota archaeon]|nr:DUF262 domain-containing protein [Nanoarchaeota archaeon]